MKIGFYDPYFDSLGGGERYVLTLASHWSKKHSVFLFWNDPAILKKAQERFSLDLERVKVTSNIFLDKPFLSKQFLTSQYDIIFFVSDGSVPYTRARRNILLFQAPFSHVPFPFPKRIRYQAIIVYSEFTKNNIDPSVGKRARVIAPPVDIEKFTPGRKEKLILSVGRFSSLYQAKKQHVLIDAFRSGREAGLFRGWELVLAGGVLPSDRPYFDSCVQKAHDLPIRFFPNYPFDELRKLYGKSTIYWHAAGYGEEDPTKMEHFGITTVEAMASGCVPIVYKGGGQPEIVRHTLDGFLWSTQEELLEYTKEVISKTNLQQTIRRNAVLRAKIFTSQTFCERFDTLLTTL